MKTGTVLTRFSYDPLGRRVTKSSEAIVPCYWNAGRLYHRTETERFRRELNLGTTFYGWEGERLVWESTKKRGAHHLFRDR